MFLQSVMSRGNRKKSQEKEVTKMFNSTFTKKMNYNCITSFIQITSGFFME